MTQVELRHKMLFSGLFHFNCYSCISGPEVCEQSCRLHLRERAHVRRAVFIPDNVQSRMQCYLSGVASYWTFSQMWLLRQPSQRNTVYFHVRSPRIFCLNLLPEGEQAPKGRIWRCADPLKGNCINRNGCQRFGAAAVRRPSCESWASHRGADGLLFAASVCCSRRD
ncbi:MAG: hypothetical protein JWL77_232 [Chthonomonadaceae bacterium]|nr:hypothetical protein [Chthonomonadaceae bacterium]